MILIGGDENPRGKGSRHSELNRELAKLSRRDLLRLACLTGLGLAIPLIRSSSIGQIRDRQQGLQGSIRALGTNLTISIGEEFSPVRAFAAIEDAFGEIRRLESEFTRFNPSSQVYRLNQILKLERPVPELVEVLQMARRFSAETQGAFDITVKPALDLLERCSGGNFLPSDAEFESTKRLIDFEQVYVSKDLASLGKPGMAVTLDCIGKGYLLDRAAARLRAHGIRSALIQGGGTLVAMGARPDGSPWRIGIRDPINPNGLIGRIDLSDGAVATSGDYEDFFSPDGRFYHIVDPSTACSPLYSHSATVIAPTAAEADPLGVSLMVKEPREGLRLLEDFKGCECLIATRGGQFIRSNGFREIK